MGNFATLTFLCFVWGTTWLAIKVSLEGLPPFLGAAVRFGVAVILLLIVTLAKRLPLKIDRKSLAFVIASAFFLYVFDYGMIYWGEQYLNAGVTAIFFAPYTIFTAIWSRAFRLEPFRWNVVLGLILGLLGTVVVFYDQLLSTQFDRQVILASGAVLLGGIGGALALVLVKKYLSEMHVFTLTLYQMAAGFLFLFCMSRIWELGDAAELNPHVIGAVLYLGLIGSALAFVLYYKLLQKMSAVSISLIIYITPLVALAGDFLMFDKTIPLRSFGGMAILFSGIAATQFRVRKRPARI